MRRRVQGVTLHRPKVGKLATIHDEREVLNSNNSCDFWSRFVFRSVSCD